MTALIGMDDWDYLLSNFAQYFNRDMPSMSKRVKAIRARLAKNRSMYEKMGHIKTEIATIRKACPDRRGSGVRGRGSEVGGRGELDAD